MLLQLKAHEENAHRHAFGKGKAHLIAFSGNCGSSSIQRENLSKRKFVKRLVIKIENLSMNIFCSAILKSTDLSCPTNGSFKQS